MTYERGKWEQLARELAATIREQEQLQERMRLLMARRGDQERALWRELEKEDAPLAPEPAPVLRGVDLGRPAGSRLRWCALKDCEVQGPHGHGVDG